MALVDWSLGAFNNGAAQAFFTYDDVSNLIESVTLVNNGASGTLTATLRNPQTQAIVFGPTSRTFGTGSFTQDVSARGLHMVSQTGKGGTVGVAPPFDSTLQWSSA